MSLTIDLNSLLVHIAIEFELLTINYYCYLLLMAIPKIYIKNQLKLLQFLWDQYSYFTSLVTIYLCILAHISSHDIIPIV